ncbi:MAG: proline--tRNA ligase [Patescibacteria group bacterium]|nr:proline--tRNA ligase [Patescibacteria group bacterium]
MRQSKYFLKTLRKIPKEAETVSHQLLVRGCFIEQLTSGVWNFLPLGWRVHQKIEEIIRQEMNAIGGQEVYLPVLQPKEIWQKSDRWEKMDPPLFKLKDRHHKDLALGPTHEEVMTEVAKKFIQSYKDLPLALYQIQVKFRNEMRSTGGLLRTREFVMKDLYSFHATADDLDHYYQKVLQAYLKIYQRCDLTAIALEAATGPIGGSQSHEFLVLSDSGEDKILICDKSHWSSKEEMARNQEKCPKCGGWLSVKKGIEAGHIFKLGTKYSQVFNLNYLDKDGQKKLVEMGCYGIGLGRLMATIVEAHHDEKGIIWPESVAPFQYHLLVLDQKEKKVKDWAEKVYESLIKKGIEVLYDERDVSAGIKFQDADLIGLPYRLVISRKTGQRIEVKKRGIEKKILIDLKKLLLRK